MSETCIVGDLDPSFYTKHEAVANVKQRILARKIINLHICDAKCQPVPLFCNLGYGLEVALSATTLATTDACHTPSAKLCETSFITEECAMNGFTTLVCPIKGSALAEEILAEVKQKNQAKDVAFYDEMNTICTGMFNISLARSSQIQTGAGLGLYIYY